MNVLVKLNFCLDLLVHFSLEFIEYFKILLEGF